MAIWNLYSKRQKQLRGDTPDVYVYDKIPDQLRAQIVHILKGVLGSREECMGHRGMGPRNETVAKVYRSVKNMLCREYGIFALGKSREDEEAIDQLFRFILETPNAEYEKVLDAVEVLFAMVDYYARQYEYRHHRSSDKEADAAIDELNHRFKEHGIGYEFIDRKIMRIDSEFIHQEAVKPAIQVLSDKDYKNANEEFLEAHEHYRQRRYKDCMVWALKSLESTMKIICKRRKWACKQADTASTLIDTCFDNGLIPSFWQSHFGSLRAMLQSSVPTARNVTSSHGQGNQQVEVPGYLAAYCLHMTASTLVFLVEAEKALS